MEGPLVSVPPPPPPQPAPPLSAPPAVCSPGPRTPMSPVALPVPLPLSTTTSSMIPLKLDAPKPVYSSPPPAASSPENNTCRMIEYRGAKVAAFSVDGRELICLPQAFELFLKHLVGGLHTVYTKLKRLDITPIVCNVEQVRILRGLGAIQPGVNRCKLISPKEFDVLYDDCTNSSARPGRPPKRSPSMTATPETLEKLKKSRMDNGDYPGYHHPRLLVPPPSMFADPKKSPLFSNGYHYPPHLAASLPFMPLGHPMMSMAMAGHLGMRPDGSIIRERPPNENDLTSPRPRDDRCDEVIHRYEDNNNKPLDKPLNLEIDKQRDRRPSNTDKESGMSTPSEIMVNGQLDLTTRPHHMMHSHTDDMTGDDDSDEDKDDDESGSDVPQQATQNGETSTDKLSSASLGNYSHLLNTENSGISSIDTLLMNIQGLLKVASENARHRERQMNYEKAELKMELLREREMRENLEKQLMDEHRNRAGLQKRLKKEKKARRKLQEQLEMGGVKPLPSDDGMERHSPDNLRMMSDSLGSHGEQSSDRECPMPDDRRLTDARSGLQNLMDTFLGQQQKSCSSVNGYIHSPVIKQTESV